MTLQGQFRATGRCRSLLSINRQDGTRWARVLADPSTQVRKAAATHGYFTPQFVWTALATDPDPAVRKAVASSRWAPAELQRRLLSDTDLQVSAAANTRDPLLDITAATLLWTNSNSSPTRRGAANQSGPRPVTA